MQTPRLIFHPRDPQQLVAQPNLNQAMQGIGFIGQRLQTVPGESYAAGEHFIELLSFLGCSPVINLSAADGDKFCYVELLSLSDAELLIGSQPFQPRCRQCRTELPDWQMQWAQQRIIECPGCGIRMAPQQVNWRQSAGFARQFMLVHNIYLHEAVPGEKLMGSLQACSENKKWNYFYAI